MPKTVSQIFHELQEAQLGTRGAKLVPSSEVEPVGRLDRLGRQLNVGLGFLADLPQRAFLGEDFQEIRSKNPGTQQIEIPQAQDTLDKTIDLARFLPEIGVEAAAIAGTGGTAAPALLARRVGASAVAGGLGGLGSAVSDPTKSFQEIAFDTAVATGVSFAAPFVGAGLGKGVSKALGREAIKFGDDVLPLFDASTRVLVQEGINSADPFVRRSAAELMQNLHDNLTKGTKLLDDPLPEELLVSEARQVFRKQLEDSLLLNVGEEAVENANKVFNRLDNTQRQVVEGATDGMSPSQAADFFKDVDGALIAPASPKDIAKFTDFVFKARAAAMLSSPRTLARNVFFTFNNQLLRRTSDFVAGSASLAKSKITGQPQEVFVREALAGAKGFVPERVARVMGFYNELPQALSEFARATRISREVIDEAPEGFVGKYIIGAPFKALQVTDQALYMREFAAEAYRQATNRALKANPALKGQGLSDAVQRILADRSFTAGNVLDVANTEAQKRLGAEAGAKTLEAEARRIVRSLNPEDAPGTSLANINEIRNLSERAIFIANEGKKIDKYLTDISDFADPWLSIFLPFRRTPANAAREFLRATPLGFVPRWQGAVAAGLDPAAAANFTFREQARAATGTGVAMGLMGLIHTGVVQANPFTRLESKAQRDTENAAGIPQDEVRLHIGSFEFGTSGRNLGELGQVILSLQEGMDAVNRGEINEGQALLEGITVNLVRRIADDTFAGDLRKLLDVALDERGDKTRRVAEDFGGSFVPAAFKDIQDVFNAEQRTADTPEAFPGIEQALAVGSGFTSELGTTGQPRLGLFGQPLTQRGQGETSDPLAQRMLEIGAVHQAPTSPTGISLPGDQDTAFRQAKGKLQRQAVSRAVSLKNFNRLPTGVQKKLVDRAFSRASNIANRRAKLARARGVPVTQQMILTGKVGLGR